MALLALFMTAVRHLTPLGANELFLENTGFYPYLNAIRIQPQPTEPMSCQGRVASTANRLSKTELSLTPTRRKSPSSELPMR